MQLLKFWVAVRARTSDPYFLEYFQFRTLIPTSKINIMEPYQQRPSPNLSPSTRTTIAVSAGIMCLALFYKLLAIFRQMRFRRHAVQRRPGPYSRVTMNSSANAQRSTNLPAIEVPPERSRKPDINFVLRSLKHEMWMSGRHCAYNRKTETISLFSDDSGSVSNLPIPLRYQGYPLLPHSFSPPETSPVLPVSLQPAFQGITSSLGPDHIEGISILLPELTAIDAFEDGTCVLLFDDNESRLRATQTIGSETFRIGTFFFVMAVGLLLEEVSQTEADFAPSDGNENHVPGSKVFNDKQHSSTMGVYLHPYPTSTARYTLVRHFTVSSHSFIRRKHLLIHQGLSPI